MLIVEDGTGLPDSNSYVSAEEANQYFSARSNQAWENAFPDQKAAALVAGTQFVDSTYGHGFVGRRASNEQALNWPRSGAWNAYGFKESGIPRFVKVATMEAAVYALSNELFTDVNSGEVVQSMSAGSFSVSFADSRGKSRVVVSASDLAIRPVVQSSNDLYRS